MKLTFRNLIGCALPILLFFVLLAAVMHVFVERSFYGFDAYHEGVMFKPALDVASGQILFRETFTQYGALTTYIHSLFIRFMGPELMSIRYATLFFYFLGFGFFVLWARFLNLWWAAVLALYLVFIYAPFLSPQVHPLLSWSSVLVFVIQAGAVLLLLRQHLWPRKGLFFCGGLTLLAFHTRQPVAIFFAGAITLALLCQGLCFYLQKLDRDKFHLPLVKLKNFWYGFLSSGLLVALLMLIRGNLNTWWKQNIVWVFSYAKGASNGFTFSYFDAIFPNFNSSLAQIPLMLLVIASPFMGKFLRIAFSTVLLIWALVATLNPGLLPMWSLGASSFVYLSLILLVSALWLFVKKVPEGQDWSIWIVGSAALSSWLQVVPLADPQHMYWALLICMPWMVFHYFYWCRRTPALLVIFVLGLLPSLYSSGRQVLSWDASKYEWSSETSGVVSSVKMKPASLHSLQLIRGALEECWELVGPDTPIKNLTTNAFFGVLAENLENSSPNNFYWSGLPHDFANGVAQMYLKEKRPVVITGWWEHYTKASEVSFYEALLENDYRVFKKVKPIDLPFTGAVELWFWLPEDIVAAAPAGSGSL